MLTRSLLAVVFAVVFFALGIWAAPKMTYLTGWFSGAQRTVQQVTGVGGSAGGVNQSGATKNSAMPNNSAQNQEVEVSEALEAARQASSEGDINEAVSAYEALISDEPSNPDHYGELGNVYYASGQMERAAEAYANAAELLIENGNTQAVMSLLPVIARGDETRANELYNRISEKN